MPTTIGNHGVAAFANPSNGDTLDATIVKGNDNTLRSAYVEHDTDPGIHVQSSLLASRPSAGTEGRKWVTTDAGNVKFWHDTGTAWEELAYAQTVNATFTGTTTLQQTLEKVTISATAATGTINYDVLTQAVLYYTSNASANWTLNIRGDGSNTLDSRMAVGQSLTVVFAVTNGATPYRPTAHQIDGSSITPRWAAGVAPAAGNASAIDAYTYTIIKTGAATFVMLASFGMFK